MIPYFILLFTVLIIFYFKEKTSSNKIIRKFYLRIGFLILVLFAGLRDMVVGSDTSGYAIRFENKKISLDTFFSSSYTNEWGYHFIEFIAALFSNEYVAILIVTASIAVFFQLKAINKISNLPLVSIFILITFGIYTYVFNGARQALAAAIYMYSIIFLIQGNFRKYTIWILIAFLFHKSVIFGIPLYFLFRKKFTKKLVFLLILFALTLSTFFNVFLDFTDIFNLGYSSYQEIDVQGGTILTLIYFILSIFYILMRSNINRIYLSKYDIFLNMFIFGTIICIVVYFTGSYVEITRLAFYYLTTVIFIWPIILKSLKNETRLVFSSIFVITHLTFYYIFITKMGDLYPYLLNRSIF